MKTKKYLETLIVLSIKCTGMVKTKHKDFIDAALIIPCQNLSWIMGLRIYGEERTQISLSSGVFCQGSRIDRIYADIKIANNTKINHINGILY